MDFIDNIRIVWLQMGHLNHIHAIGQLFGHPKKKKKNYNASDEKIGGNLKF
jgi:hypothetical protein